MCGISGIYSLNGNIQPARIKRMTDCLHHRGPDDEGYVYINLREGRGRAYAGEKTLAALQLPPPDGDAGRTCDLVLGHRRLSILDLSPAGHGPMSYKGGKLWITYNGEIYNYLELRNELKVKGYPFQTQTDTEVILAAYDEWGIDCLKHFNGMWAFALVDLEKKRIFCTRDRAGVKPFYYTFDGKRFCFASEIKALLQVDGVKAEPNEQIIADYLFSGYLDHTSETFFKNIYQLRPGEFLLFEGNRFITQSYWDIEDKEIRFARDQDYTERFFELLQDSIRLRLRSDVPIGTCLSGGLDSSSIVCLANRLMFDGRSIDPRLIGERQKTFSSCFENSTYDERRFIELIIQKTEAEKNYVFPQGERLFEDMSKLIWHQDEPFGSTSIYAQWQVMQTAKSRGVTVLLDGQGGDELLAGYFPSFYFLLGGRLKRMEVFQWLKELKGLQQYHGRLLNQFLPGMLMALFPPSILSWLGALSNRRKGWAAEDFEKKYFRSFPTPGNLEDELNNYLYRLFRFFALPGLLHYEDRNSMAYSIETRLPFLDYRLVEYLFSLPPEQKIKEGVTKVILRRAMEGVLPEQVRNRTDKIGFITPEGLWLRTVLRDKIDELLGSKSFAERGYFEVNRVKDFFRRYCEGKVQDHAIIWRWVNLELWLRMFIDKNHSEKVGVS